MKKIWEPTEHREKEVLIYFQNCPLCLARKSMSFEWGSSEDYMSCIQCGARWHLNYGVTGFHWAELVKVDATGKNRNELLNVKHQPHFWILMALEGLKSKPPVTFQISDKNIVEAKIRCPFCNKLYDKTKDNCPYCGGV